MAFYKLNVWGIYRQLFKSEATWTEHAFAELFPIIVKNNVCSLTNTQVFLKSSLIDFYGGGYCVFKIGPCLQQTRSGTHATLKMVFSGRRNTTYKMVCGSENIDRVSQSNLDRCTSKEQTSRRDGQIAPEDILLQASSTNKDDFRASVTIPPARRHHLHRAFGAQSRLPNRACIGCKQLPGGTTGCEGTYVTGSSSSSLTSVHAVQNYLGF